MQFKSVEADPMNLTVTQNRLKKKDSLGDLLFAALGI